MGQKTAEDDDELALFDFRRTGAIGGPAMLVLCTAATPPRVVTLFSTAIRLLSEEEGKALLLCLFSAT